MIHHLYRHQQTIMIYIDRVYCHITSHLCHLRFVRNIVGIGNWKMMGRYSIALSIFAEVCTNSFSSFFVIIQPVIFPKQLFLLKLSERV